MCFEGRTQNRIARSRVSCQVVITHDHALPGKELDMWQGTLNLCES